MTNLEQYRPRRSSKRWLDDAPEYVMACYDNGGKSDDRYTVLFGGSLWSTDYVAANLSCGRDPRLIDALSMSDSPTHPQGVSIWGDAIRGRHLGQKVRWLDLPDHIRAHVTTRVEQD